VLLDKLGRVEARQKAPADLVTEADTASQDLIFRMLREKFPDHGLLGEEDCQPDGVSAGSAPYRWIVDPLDGTTNYVHGVPHFCVSVALEHDGELLVGVVYNPVADECFSATAGGGALLNGKRIHASSISTIGSALAAIGFPPGVNRDCPDLKAFLSTLPHCQAIRRTGSAALNLCYVAAGRFDATWSFSTRIWDMAAGVLLVREAGGVATSPSGGSLDLPSGQFLACANPQLHAELMLYVTRPAE
jgi:myo-inositol-1(or 4)-monophosphatase